MTRQTGMLIGICGLLLAEVVQAATPVDELLMEYRQQSVNDFTIVNGRNIWNQPFRATNTTEERSCTTCHTNDVRQTGKHAVTGKEIKPLAPSVMSKRLTNPDKIRKWLKRNCEWTLGRECNAQEKGDILTYLKDL